MMASPHWKPFQAPNNHQNATSASSFGRQSSFTSSLSNSSSSPNSYNNVNNNNRSDTYLNNSNPLSSSPGASGGFREAGIVEKLLPSYGFIQCCERQARLFFHYSQYSGNIEHLKLGDPVEFEMTYDRRTGKPIASLVVKISSEALIGEETSCERVKGFITTEIFNEKEGRVAYENRGECFFLPFTKDDVDDEDLVLKCKDSVTFHIATDKSGNLRARRIKLEMPTSTALNGVVCTLKDSFGFIERADVVKEIFFHSSECQDFKDLSLGDDVEFTIQIRNNKEVAVAVNRLQQGTVVFEDVASETITGKIVKTLDKASGHNVQRQQHLSSNNSSDPFPGRIKFNIGDGELETTFGERDVKGEYTLQIGDWVKFNMVTDRRDKLKHGTNIAIVEDSLVKSGEHREQGYIAALKDTYGFIKCLNREGSRLYFKLSEMLDPNTTLKLNDEVEFTVAPDLSLPGRLQAIRIKLVPNGTIFKNLLTPKQNQSLNVNKYFVTDSEPQINGVVDYTSVKNVGIDTFNSLAMNRSYRKTEFPLIDFSTDLNALNLNKTEETRLKGTSQGNHVAKSDSWSEILSQIPLNLGSHILNGMSTDLLTSSDSNDGGAGGLLEPTTCSNGSGDADSTKVSPKQNKNIDSTYVKPLSIIESISRTNELNSIEVNNGDNRFNKNGLKRSRGVIAALKDGFGFIENESHQNEVFFHYSVYMGDIQTLDLGQEVEYTTVYKGSKLSAECVVDLPSGTLPTYEPQADMFTGQIIRSVRCLNPDQEEYPGIVESLDSNGETQQYEFSMTSLEDMHDFVQKGDTVTFFLDTVEPRAVAIKSIRNKHQATIDSIKSSFGFINYEAEEGKKLFFHMSEVRDPDVILQPGDRVEFVVVYNQRSGKYSACSVVKLSDNAASQRPDRLISKIKTSADEATGPRVITIRQPKGPDGTKGFSSRQLTTN